MAKKISINISGWMVNFVLGLAAVFGTEVALFPNEPGNDINLYGYYQVRILPRLLWWSIIFIVLSSFKLVLWMITRKETRSDNQQKEHV